MTDVQIKGKGRISNQIIRFDGRDCFMEVMDSAFEIGKVMMNFIQYDMSKPQGERYTNKITIYMDIHEFETLAYSIKMGILDRAAYQARENQRAGGYKYCKEVYLDFGGTTREALAKRDESREDNKDESRQFKIIPGEEKPWILSAEKGAGKRLNTGLISPDGMPDTRINVPLEEKYFRKFAVVVDNEIQAWKIAQRVMRESEENMDMFKKTLGGMFNMITRIQTMVEIMGIRLFNKAS